MTLCETALTCAGCIILTNCYFLVTDLNPDFTPKGKCVNVREAEELKAALNLTSPDDCYPDSKLINSRPYTVVKAAWDLLREIKAKKLKNYDKNVSPEKVINKSTVVRVQLDLIQFNIIEFPQPQLNGFGYLHLAWNDTRLIWDSFGQNSEVSEVVSSNIEKDWKVDFNIMWFTDNEVWMPHIMSKTNSSIKKVIENSSLVGVYPHPNDLVRTEIPVFINCPCEVDLFSWPFDSYSCFCSLTLESNPRNKNKGGSANSPLMLKTMHHNESHLTKKEFVSTKYLQENLLWTLFDVSRITNGINCIDCSEISLTLKFVFGRSVPFLSGFVISSILVVLFATILVLILDPMNKTLNRVKLIIALLDYVYIAVVWRVFESWMPSSDSFPVLLRMFTWTLRVVLVSIVMSTLCLFWSQSKYLFLHLHFPKILHPLISNRKYLKFLHLDHHRRSRSKSHSNGNQDDSGEDDHERDDFVLERLGRRGENVEVQDLQENPGPIEEPKPVQVYVPVLAQVNNHFYWCLFASVIDRSICIVYSIVCCIIIIVFEISIF